MRNTGVNGSSVDVGGNLQASYAVQRASDRIDGFARGAGLNPYQTRAAHQLSAMLFPRGYPASSEAPVVDTRLLMTDYDSSSGAGRQARKVLPTPTDPLPTGDQLAGWMARNFSQSREAAMVIDVVFALAQDNIPAAENAVQAHSAAVKAQGVERTRTALVGTTGYAKIGGGVGRGAHCPVDTPAERVARTIELGNGMRFKVRSQEG